jgi:hypothetical protein
MDTSFTPSPDVSAILNALLDILERRPPRNPQDGTRNTEHATRSIKLRLSDIPIPFYFSQTDPEPRLIANRQLQELETLGLVKLTWLPGETGHLLAAVTLPTEHATRHTLYPLIHRTPLASSRSNLETLLLADQFRFPPEDWRARAVRHTLNQLRAGKSPAPFSLTDPECNLDLLTLLAALPDLAAETPYRVFSVRVFNDSKRFEALKPALVSLARRANPQWKAFPADELLRELNLVANPGYIHLAGNWQFTTETGEILGISGFTPSVGFPAAQAAAIQSIAIHADAVLFIENLTTFHEFVRADGTRNTEHALPASCSVFRVAVLCTMGNPSPALRRLLRLIPDETPIHLWADLDYGGFNILSQLRRQVRPDIQPYRMDVAAFESCAHFSRPLTQTDYRYLKGLFTRPELSDVQPMVGFLLKCGLKLEQEAFEFSHSTDLDTTKSQR